MIGCWFEGTTLATIEVGDDTVVNPNHYYIDVAVDASLNERPRSILIEGCFFHRTGPQSGDFTRTKAIKVGATSRGVVIIAPYISLARPPAADEHVKFDSDVQASLLGGTIQAPNNVAYPLRVDDDKFNRSALMNGLYQLRIPRIVSPDEAERDLKALEGDIVYDLSTHTLKLCVGFSGGTPPAPIWQNIYPHP